LLFGNAIDPFTGTTALTAITAGVGAILARRNRTRAETEAERREKRLAVQRQVEALVSEFHALLPKSHSNSIGGAYARYSTSKQGSVIDQLRAIFTFAVANGIFIPLEFVFFDLAEKGQKQNRQGLNDLKAILRLKKVSVALFFATNRFFRKTHASLRFVDEEIVERGIRVIFVAQGIDSSNSKDWRLLHQFHSIIDEFSGSMYGSNISAALIGLVKEGLVCGVIHFGYKGVPLEGRKTRRGTPCHRLVICEIASKYVIQIFQWYVNDGISIDEIARRLNDAPYCPPPPKASVHGWRHASVIVVLENTIYRGLRQFGNTKNVWLSSKDYAKKEVRESPLVEDFREEYRIVSDELFEAAQLKLASDKKAYSCNYERDKNPNPLKVMNGLFECGVHKQRIYFSGTRGRYGLCPACRAESLEKRALFSHFPRARAIQMTCSTLARVIQDSPALVERVIVICQQRIENLQKPDEGKLQDMEKRKTRLQRDIDFILRNPGETEEDVLASEQRLREVRHEKAALDQQLHQLRYASTKPTIVPTKDSIQELLVNLAEVLSTDAKEDMEQARRLRHILDLLTGGVIELYQMGENTAHRGWLQGRFKLQLLKALSNMDAQLPSDIEDDGKVITVDFQRLPKAKAEPTVEFLKDVKRLYEQNKPIKVIQRLLKCAYITVDEALGRIYGPDRKTRPHPNARRAQASYEYDKQPLFRLIADRVKALADEGKLLQEIALELKADRNTVKASWKYWYEVRGLQAPDGRARRKELNAQRKALAHASTSLPLTEGSDAESKSS
jgi:site-specific DNA recombinase